MFKNSPLLRQYVVVIAVNISIMCVGLDLGWTSPVLVKLRDPQQTPLSRSITDDECGWLASIGYIFSIFMIPCVGFLVNLIGKKFSLLLVFFPKIFSSMLTIFATDVWMLLVARGISLTANTSVMMIVTIYTAEIASKEIRGSLGSFVAIFCSLGGLIMLGTGPYMSYFTLSVLLTAFTISACIPLFFIPETPYTLYKRGKIDEAKDVLIFFRGSEALAESELKGLSQTKPSEKFDISEIFKNRAYIKAMIIAVVMGAAVQLVGFNFIWFYLQTILESTDTVVPSALGSLIIGITQVLASTSAGVFTDRFGRKPILITTLLGIALGMMGLATFFTLKQYGVTISGCLNYLPLISIAIVTFGFSAGIGTQFFVTTTELLDDKIRPLGSSTSMVTATILGFLISRYSLNILSGLGSVASFSLFALLNITMSLFVGLVVPETKQKTFAEIQRALEGVKGDVESKEDVSRF